MPSVPGLSFPLINGHVYSFASIQVWFADLPLPQISFKAINYKTELKPGVMYGTAPDVLGMTRGVYTVTADAEIFRLSWEPLKAALGFAGVGYGEQFFTIVVQYSELNMPVITDVLRNFRITNADYTNAQGSEASTVKLTMMGLSIIENGAEIVVSLVGV